MAEKRRGTEVARGVLATTAYELLRSDVIRCEIAPGTRFTEAGLVERLGFGKTPIREALTRLIHDRLVRSLPGHGYEATPITLQDVEDLFACRRLLEPEVVGLAVGRVDVGLLRRLDARGEAAYAKGSRRGHAEFLGANAAFHRTVAAASGNRRLTDLVGGILDECERLFHLGLAVRGTGPEFAHDHGELVDALAAGDRAAARDIAVRQVEESRAVVTDALLRSPALLQAPLTG